MARSKNTKSGQRDNSSIARPRRLSREPSFVTVSPTPTLNLTPVSDGRTWHPEGPNRPALSNLGRPVHVQPVNRPGRNLTKWQKDRFGDSLRSQTKGALAFVAPSQVIVCIRRKRRKETLFALKKTKKGAASRKRQNKWTSKLTCRR